MGIIRTQSYGKSFLGYFTWDVCIFNFKVFHIYSYNSEIVFFEYEMVLKSNYKTFLITWVKNRIWLNLNKRYHKWESYFLTQISLFRVTKFIQTSNEKLLSKELKKITTII